MLTGNQFVISFPEVIPNPIGLVLGDEQYRVNYYKSALSKETMCCNCDHEDPIV